MSLVNEFIKNKKALIVEDELAIAQLLKIHLLELGFEVEICNSAESAFELLQTKVFDLGLLDWMLPGVQGLDFLKKIKPKFPLMKIMMVTAKVDPDSIVLGLDSGADDYLAKPFDGKVLSARVKHLMRRLQTEIALSAGDSERLKNNTDQVFFDGLSIHFTQHIVKYNNEVIHLTLSEFKLLASLYKSRGSVLTRDQLIGAIQGEDVSVTSRTIDTHIFALRKKIGEWSKHIETIRGVGYRILISTDDLSEEVL
ncbi:MAG: response regulator transcription factor [Bdellovibrionota bacterium]